MEKRIRLVVLNTIALFLISIIFYHNSYAAEFYRNSPTQLKGYSHETGIKFSATRLTKDTVKISLKFNNKAVTIKFRNEGANISVDSYDFFASDTAKFTANDSMVIEKLLLQLSKRKISNQRLRKIMLRSLNLLYSWPIGQPVYVVVANESIKSKMDIGEYDQYFSEYGFTGACEWPPSFDLSESLCPLINQEHEGEILIGWPTGYFWFDNPLLPIFYPLFCASFPKEVGPFPFDQGDCFGRCGKGCIGDGPPNNDLNIFTQNCFNHDGCAAALGIVHPLCNQMFLYAINDFFLGEDCPVDVSVINGSFEEPQISPGSFMTFQSIPGWTLSLGPDIEIQNHWGGWNAYDGDQLVELDSHGNSGMIPFQ
jgi:hypothetical protein